MASTAISTSPWPVMRMTGSSGSSCCARRRSSIPSVPSILRSVTRTPGKSALSRPSAETASAQTITSKPASSSHWVTACRIEASSSTNRTGPRSGMDRLLHCRLQDQARKLDDEFGAAAGAVLRMHAAAEILHDAVGDGEPEPKALADRLGSHERIENALDHLGRNARTVVGDADADRVLRGTHLDVDRGLFDIGHGIERVGDEVDQHLFELHGVSRHPQTRLDIT